MPARYLILALTLGSLARLSAQEPVLKPGDFVAMCGDSITEQRRYTSLIEDYLLMCQPEPDLRGMCMGWNGETSWGFLKRMTNDAATFQPNVVTTCLGMNDSAAEFPAGEREKMYRDSLSQIVQTFQDAGVRSIIVGTPGAVDTDTYKKGDPAARNASLKTLAGIARQVAEEKHVGFADVNTPMREVMAQAKAKYGSAYHVAGLDGVHPEMDGHVIMAYAFLKAMGLKGDIGTITFDIKTGAAEATRGHKILSASASAVEVESTRYPFCFSGEPSDPTGTLGILEFLSFNQDLNRYLLVVKNAPSAKLKVTWGKASKVFSAADLERGVNLAAEFPDNPFSDTFARIHQAVRDKEGFDIRAVKSMQHSLLDWKEIVPRYADQYAAMTQELVEREKAESAKLRAMVVPIKHKLVIEPAS